jgi:hypothetical protein
LVGSPYLVDASEQRLDPNAVPAGLPIFIHKDYQAANLPPFGYDGGTTYVIRNQVDDVAYWHPGGWNWGVGIPGVTNWTEYWGGWQTEPGTHTASGKLDNFDNFASNDAASRSWQFTFTTAARPTVTIAATDKLATEADLHHGEFTVTRAGNSNFAMTVPYTVTGNAVAGTDYQALSGSVVFAAGQTSAKIAVIPLADDGPEDREHVLVTLNPGDTYVVGAANGDGKSATVDIKNDTTVTVAAKPDIATDPDHPGVFTISRVGDTADKVTVNFKVGGTAKAGTDYQDTLGTSIDIPAGEKSVTINVTPKGATPVDGGKTVILTLQDTSDYKLGDTKEATVTLTHDPKLLPKVRIDINQTETKDDDITFYHPGGYAQPIKATITNLSNVKGRFDLAGVGALRGESVKFDQDYVDLDAAGTPGARTTVTITPDGTTASSTANDLAIQASFNGVDAGQQTMTIVDVILPAEIKAKDTPAGMPPRIPPRVNSDQSITLSADLTGSGQTVTLVAAHLEGNDAKAGTGGANGTFTINAKDSRDLYNSDTIQLSSLANARGDVNQTTPGNAGNLCLLVQVRKENVAHSSGFSVAAIPVQDQATFTSAINGVIPALPNLGEQMGMIVTDHWVSDSGRDHPGDLDQVLVREQIEIVEQNGSLAHVGLRNGNNGPYNPANGVDSTNNDQHTVPKGAVNGDGFERQHQTHEFQDLRTGARDIPLANSGYEITFQVSRGVNAQGVAEWQLTTSKVGLATEVNQIKSDAGHPAAAITLQQGVNDTPTATVLVDPGSHTSLVGQAVTFQAAVLTSDGNEVHDGQVEFRDVTTNTVLGTMDLNADGQAEVQTAALAVGNHAIVAAYLRHNQLLPSQSEAETFTVRVPTTTIIQSSAANNQSVRNQQVIFTATVSAPAPAPVPQGRVRFTDRTTGKILGTVDLNNGKASQSTSDLDVGDHEIEARFLGDDADFEAPSVSDPTVPLKVSLGPDNPLQQLPYYAFASLTPDDVPQLTPEQIASIPDNYWFTTIPVEDRAALTVVQVQALNTAVVDIGLLTSDQVAELTPAQVQQLPFSEFRYVLASQVPALTADQIASIPDAYWLATMAPETRAALTATQVQALNTATINIGYLTSAQVAELTPAEVQLLPYSEFQYLPAEQVPLLTTAQIAAIPDNYWFTTMPADDRAALTPTQVQALNTSVIDIGLLTPGQTAALTQDQVRQLAFWDFRYVPMDAVPWLTTDQIASIADSYWFATMSAQQRAALTRDQVQALDTATIYVGYLTSEQIAELTATQIDKLPAWELPLLSGAG